MNSRLIGQVPDARKDRRQEDEMAGWHYRCNEPELGQTAGGGEEQGGPGELQSLGLQTDMTGRLNKSAKVQALVCVFKQLFYIL